MINPVKSFLTHGPLILLRPNAVKATPKAPDFANTNISLLCNSEMF